MTTIVHDDQLNIQYLVDKPTAEQIIRIAHAARALGPSATVFMIQAATRCRNGVFYETHDVEELREQLGKVSPAIFWRTIGRLERFGVAHRDATGCLIIGRWPA